MFSGWCLSSSSVPSSCMMSPSPSAPRSAQPPIQSIHFHAQPVFVRMMVLRISVSSAVNATSVVSFVVFSSSSSLTRKSGSIVSSVSCLVLLCLDASRERDCGGVKKREGGEVLASLRKSLVVSLA